MSRSYKKAIIKDKHRTKKSSAYWRPIRSRINQEVREGKWESITDPKIIVNDYNYNVSTKKIEFYTPDKYYIYSEFIGKPKENILKEKLEKGRRK